jgi:hypothetical protein
VGKQKERNAMKPKFLLFLTWVFYLLDRRTADEIWTLCMIYCAVLTTCAFLYRKDKGNTPKGEQKGEPA